MKKNILSQNFWIGLVNPWLEIPSKTQTNLEVTENDYDDEWVRSGFSIVLQFHILVSKILYVI